MWDVLYYLAMVAVMGASFLFLKAQRRKTAERHLPKGRADAARLGWEFEVDQTAIFEIYRWRGTTSGVTWVAEALRTGRDRHHSNRSTTRIVRWYTLRPLRVAAPIALVRATGRLGTPSILPAAGEGMLARLSQSLVAKALDIAFDVRFGEPLGRLVDAASLTSVSGTERDFPDCAVLAPPAHHAAALLLLPAFGEVVRSLEGSTAALSLLAAPQGLAVSAQTWVGDAEALAPIVTAGVALVSAVSVAATPEHRQKD